MVDGVIDCDVRKQHIKDGKCSTSSLSVQWALPEQIQKLWYYIFIGSPTIFSILLRGHFNQKYISKIIAVEIIADIAADPGGNR